MEKIRAINAQQINQDVQDIRNKLDSMSEMGDMDSLRLQMAMDRLAKLMTTVSNIEKKFSETDNSIIKNMK
jgi:septation ring formation regulator EzrA